MNYIKQRLLQATRGEAERVCIREFFCTVTTKFKQRKISNSIFFRYGLWNKKCFFHNHIIEIREGLARPDPAMALFGGLFLNQIKRYKIEIFTKSIYRF